MKAHHAINKLIASASLQSYQKGGEVKREPDFDYRGTLPLTLEEFPMVMGAIEEGRPSNIYTAQSGYDFDDGAKTVLYPQMRRGELIGEEKDMSREEVDAMIGRGEHFGLYDTPKEASLGDSLIHVYFSRTNLK